MTKMIRINHVSKEGKIKTLFKAPCDTGDKIAAAYSYNYYANTLKSGYIIGYEGDEVLMMHSFEFDNFGGVLITTSVKET